MSLELRATRLSLPTGMIDDVNADSEDDNFSLLTADMDEYEDSVPEEIQ